MTDVDHAMCNKFKCIHDFFASDEDSWLICAWDPETEKYIHAGIDNYAKHVVRDKGYIWPDVESRKGCRVCDPVGYKNLMGGLQ